MIKRIITYTTTLIIIIFLGANSVYLKKLTEVKAETNKQFDAKGYALDYLKNKVPPALNSSIEINQLISILQKNPTKAFNDYSHSLSIGNIKYFMIQGQGKITSIDDNSILVLTKSESGQKEVKIEMEYIFGNAVRDALGLININKFSKTADLNNVSEEINKIIRAEIVPVLKSAKIGEEVQFYGAIELNQTHLKTDNIEAIPVAVKILK